MAERGLTDGEFERGRGQLRGNLVLGLEDSSARMSRIAKADLVHGELLSIDEMLRAHRRGDASTTYARWRPSCSRPPPALAVVGPFDDADRFAAAVA